MERLKEFIVKYKENIIDDTINLIKIRSISNDTAEVTKSLNYVLNLGKSLELDSYPLLDNRIGIIEIGEGSETIGMLCHVDVVEAEDDGWEFPPFEGKVLDNFIWGRGAMDDKGPLIACIYAMKAVVELGKPLQKKIQLIIGTQEEVSWTDMEDYVKDYPLPDYGFTPDSIFPIINREKGYIDAEFCFARKKSTAGEFEILSLNGGQAVNSVPASAKAYLKGDFRKLENIIKEYLNNNSDEKILAEEEKDNIVIISEGVSTHSCFPEKGVNAIVKLCNFLNTLKLASNGADKLVSFIAEHGSDYYGRGFGIYNDSEYLNGEYIHRNVISPTILKTESDVFKVLFNLRTVYGTTRDIIECKFNEFKKLYGYELKYYDCFDPVYINKEKPFLKAMGDAYEMVSGLKNEFVLEHGTTYAKAMPNMVPFGPIFPGELDCCHEINERINIDSIIKNATIFALALSKMALSKESFK